MKRFMQSVPKQLNVTLGYVDDLSLTFNFKGYEPKKAECVSWVVKSTYQRMSNELRDDGHTTALDKNKFTANHE